MTETPEGIVKGEPLGHCSNERDVYLIHGRQLVCIGELHLKSVDCSQQRLDGFLETPPGSFESSKFIRECRIIAEAEKLCSVTIPDVMVGVVWRKITKPIHHVLSKVLVLTVRHAGRRRQRTEQLVMKNPIVRRPGSRSEFVQRAVMALGELLDVASVA